MRGARKLFALACACWSLAGCGEGHFVAPDSPLDAPEAGELRLYRRNASTPLAFIERVYIGEVLPLELRGAGEDEVVVWESDDRRLGDFVRPGELHLHAAGDFEIRARAGERETRLAVRVGAVRPTSMPPLGPEDPPAAEPTPSPTANPSASPTPTLSPTPTATPGNMPTPQPSDPFVDEVVSFTPGSGAGFGQDKLPDIVLGPPKGYGTLQGSLDVLSLGAGGVIVLKSATPILDGPGPDFIVFENAFYANGNPAAVFAEPAEVAVSQDGITFFAFDCEAENRAAGYPGCAGVSPVLANAGLNDLDPTDPEQAGGDAFDLEELGLGWALYIRIRDLSVGPGSGGNAGFDLDAVSIVYQ